MLAANWYNNKAANYHRQLLTGSGQIDVLIKRSRRKTMAIHVFVDRPVELRVPMKCPWHEIDTFLKSREGWIEASLTELAKLPVPKSPRFITGAVHAFLGEQYRLLPGKNRISKVIRIHDCLQIRCSEPDNEADIERLLDRWYRQQAQALFPARIQECLGLFKFAMPFKGLRVRKMKARWGSCSTEGEICLNSLLVQQPEPAIDFVITHELCHLLHFGHNKAFYRLLSDVMPDWQEREKLLTGG